MVDKVPVLMAMRRRDIATMIDNQMNTGYNVERSRLLGTDPLAIKARLFSSAIARIN
jgi:hypothetical protein